VNARSNVYSNVLIVDSAYPAFDDILDSQQNYVQRIVASKFNEISTASSVQAQLAVTLANKIFEDLRAIIPLSLHFPLAIVNGVQINVEGEQDGDYFLPLAFVANVHGEKHDLIDAFHEKKHKHHKEERKHKEGHKQKEEKEKERRKLDRQARE
jgi:hypothetical protein